MAASTTSQPEVTKIPFFERKAVQTSALIGGILAVQGFMMSLHVIEEQTRVEDAFDRTFSGEGLCLDGSVYDISAGAVLAPTDAESGDTVTITPGEAGQVWPVLNLVFNEGVALDEEDFFTIPLDDQQTASLLDRECGQVS